MNGVEGFFNNAVNYHKGQRTFHLNIYICAQEECLRCVVTAPGIKCCSVADLSLPLMITPSQRET